MKREERSLSISPIEVEPTFSQVMVSTSTLQIAAKERG